MSIFLSLSFPLCHSIIFGLNKLHLGFIQVFIVLLRHGDFPVFQSSAIEFIVLYNPIVLHFDCSHIFSFPTFLKWRFSILGPLLFLLYVNDLPNTSSLFTFHLFADDTNLYFSSKNLSHLEANLNHELKSVADWMKCNRLARLNISKTNFILFHSSKLKPSQSLRIKIDGTLIKQVDSTKYLGKTFDSNLTWKSHINELCLKLSKTVGILSKVRHFVDNHILVMLYYSLIYPFLTYGVQVWGLTFPSF